MTETTFDYANVILSLADINDSCQQYITRYYPVGKQLTIERVGSEAEKGKMHTFIDACLVWANQENPRMDDLLKITP